MPESSSNTVLQIKHLCLKVKTQIDINICINKFRDRLSHMTAGQKSLANPNTFIVIYDTQENQYFFFIVFDGNNITMRRDSLMLSLAQKDVDISLFLSGRVDTFNLMTTQLQNQNYKLIYAPKVDEEFSNTRKPSLTELLKIKEAQGSIGVLLLIYPLAVGNLLAYKSALDQFIAEQNTDPLYDALTIAHNVLAEKFKNSGFFNETIIEVPTTTSAEERQRSPNPPGDDDDKPRYKAPKTELPKKPYKVCELKEGQSFPLYDEDYYTDAQLKVMYDELFRKAEDEGNEEAKKFYKKEAYTYYQRNRRAVIGRKNQRIPSKQIQSM